MLYWDTGCEIRKLNTIISWNELKKMTIFLKKNGLDVNSYLFEFGDNFIFDDSIKIEEELFYYEKSKKSNIIIYHPINNNCNYLSIIDSDLFFSEEQYGIIYEHIQELENSQNKIFFTYNLLDIDKEERNKILDLEKLEINKENLNKFKSKYSWRHSWGSGVLGGIYIVPKNEIRNMGGFNENFLTWGAEDDEAHMRIKRYASWFPKMNFGPYHLWHPKNENDKKYYIPVYSEEYFKINKVKKP